MQEVRATHGAVAEALVEMEGMQKDCWAAPARPELAALVFPYTSEQSLPSDPILTLS